MKECEVCGFILTSNNPTSWACKHCKKKIDEIVYTKPYIKWHAGNNRELCAERARKQYHKDIEHSRAMCRQRWDKRYAMTVPNTREAYLRMLEVMGVTEE